MNRMILVLTVLMMPMMAVWAQEVDMGDLPACDYPTLFGNPGHALSGIAWLGPCITSEATPRSVDLDSCDDGVKFLNPPWTPCTWVQVEITVTGGPLYPLFRLQGDVLYLNGWKDGNLDGDFCDVLCGGAAPEWIIQDVVVTPGTATYTFLDPGVLDIGVYRGVFRFRLTSQPVGPFGFGLVDTTACPGMACGSYAFDHLGEVEDYIIPDIQLAVELDYFNAVAGDGEVTLRWATVSEPELDRFEIERDGLRIAEMAGRGAGAAGAAYHYTDTGLENGRTYSYALVSVDLEGNRRTLRTVAAAPRGEVTTVSQYALHQNYPNPFNATTRIAFDMKEAGDVSIRIYNMEGKLVAVVIRGHADRGRHEVSFDAGHLPSALYICRMETAGFTADRKIILLK